MAYYNEDHLKVRYEEDLDAVMMKWKSFAQGDEFRDGLDTGLELVQNKKAKNWLADLREMGTINEDDQEWSNTDWFPRALETSLTNMAIVQPESVVANMSVENIMEEVGDGDLTTHYFDNRSEAKQWLRDQRATL
ncbi:STAS/SEC14 domain-containing protein [Halovenus marina]|uniref:STAS/SEC14 domain-containing protein n=1 Tax=Halovenus marina TaxID=3396621 RepID=UPI003F5548E9